MYRSATVKYTEQVKETIFKKCSWYQNNQFSEDPYLGENIKMKKDYVTDTTANSKPSEQICYRFTSMPHEKNGSARTFLNHFYIKEEREETNTEQIYFLQQTGFKAENARLF